MQTLYYTGYTPTQRFSLQIPLHVWKLLVSNLCVGDSVIITLLSRGLCVEKTKEWAVVKRCLLGTVKELVLHGHLFITYFSFSAFTWLAHVTMLFFFFLYLTPLHFLCSQILVPLCIYIALIFFFHILIRCT